MIVLTRVRLAGDDVTAGRSRWDGRCLDAHTVTGVLALVTWTALLVAGGHLPRLRRRRHRRAGVLVGRRGRRAADPGALGAVGGRRASAAVGDTWSDGPGLSVARPRRHAASPSCVFTWDYLFSVV